MHAWGHVSAHVFCRYEAQQHQVEQEELCNAHFEATLAYPGTWGDEVDVVSVAAVGRP